MSDIAIQVAHIGKQYRIGGKQDKYRTFRGALSEFAGRSRKTALAVIGRGDGYIYNTESFWALRDVSFDIRQGEVVGIIGRNGAGKSTLLKILSQITEPTEGSVDLYGRTSALLEVGTGFHAELTGRENVYLNGAILGMTRAEIDHKFDEIVAFSEVEKFIDTPVKNYSSGMGLRLGFAVAAFLEPEILIIDEVLAVGDAAFQKKCIGKMEQVANSGRTVLFVSHNMTAILNLCSRCVLLSDGKVAMIGDTNPVITHYMQSTQEASISDLAERTDRGGNGYLQFQKIWLEDDDGHPVDYVAAGDSTNFVIKYQAQTGETFDNVLISLTVIDLYGQNLFTCATHLHGQHFDHLTGEGIFRCHVPSVPLVPDNYTTTLWASVHGQTSDIIRDAFRFSVTESDYFGSGILPDKKKHGIFLVAHDWEQHDL